MNSSAFLSLIFIVFLVSVISCKDDDDDECNAGTGGNVTIVAKPEHHLDPVISLPSYPDSAFVKFNAQEFPGDNPALYDLVVAGESPEDHVLIEGLKCGKYFIFMTGFDTSIQERVKGGIPVQIIQTSGERIIKVPVTED
jgi:hypothetical protein